MKPILFNTDMVRAILEGRKTVTRRVVKNRKGTPDQLQKNQFDGVSRQETRYSSRLCAGFHNNNDVILLNGGKVLISNTYFRAPYEPGDILYVRETWGTAFNTTGRTVGKFVYLADGNPLAPTLSGKWSPSIHMPRRAARLFLRATGVRVERLQDIDGAESEAEGALVVLNPVIRYDKAIYAKFGKIEFKPIWDSTVKPKDRDRFGWSANPWVWVIKFERISKEEAEKWIG